MGREGYSEEFVRGAREMARIGKIPVHGVFNSEMGSLVTECIGIASRSLLSQKKEWCTLYIDSNGGYIDVLNGIRTVMQDSGLKYRGLVQSRARSAGFVLLQYCNWRVATVNTNLLVHYGGSGLWNEELTAIMEDHEYVVAYHKKRLEQMVREIAERSGVSKEKIHEYSRFERDILAQEALEMGFLDEVISLVPKSEKPTESI
jgi:ATP-dependent protease ClpP protease subunit